MNMVDREHINNFLRLNGISPASPEENIAEMLRVARWHDDDIQMALLTLKEADGAQYDMEKEKNGARNIFFSDSPISQETLTSLLGVNVSIPHARQYAIDTKRARSDQVSTAVALLIILVSVVLGVFTTLFIMYIYGIGPFYTPVENFAF